MQRQFVLKEFRTVPFRVRISSNVSQRWQRPLCDFMVQLDGPTGQSRLVEVRVLASTGLVLVVRGV
jgi:hypothetical protein